MLSFNSLLITTAAIALLASQTVAASNAQTTLNPQQAPQQVKQITDSNGGFKTLTTQEGIARRNFAQTQTKAATSITQTSLSFSRSPQQALQQIQQIADTYGGFQILTT